MTRNIAASARQRLYDLAKRGNEEFNQILVRYAIERMLYRLSQSAHAGSFVLKGATLFTVWEGNPHRVTRDLDLLGFGDDSVERMEEVFRELCTLGVADDGLVFKPESVEGEAIRNLDEYGGVRVVLVADLAGAVIPLQVDVGFGDAVKPVEVDFPVLLDFPKPHLRAYPTESVIAEKTLAIVTLGMKNSRYKDYFDLWHLSRTSSFDGERLLDAMRATFTRRDVPWPTDLPMGLTDDFGTEPAKQSPWRSFCKRVHVSSPAGGLAEVVTAVRDFVAPVLIAGATGAGHAMHWPQGGPWVAGAQ